MNKCSAVLLLLLSACGAPPTDTGIVMPPSRFATGMADYQRAEQRLTANTNALVLNNILFLAWQDDGSLIYSKTISGGQEFVLVDPVQGTASPLWDTQRLLTLLQEREGETLDPMDVSITALQRVNDHTISFRFSGDSLQLDLQTYTLTETESPDSDQFLSPDGKLAAYIDAYNLWLLDTESGIRTQLTFDGEEDYGYATNNAGWLKQDKPVLLWSDDSRRIATFRQDARDVGEMYLYTTAAGHSELEQWKYPLPGDENIFMLERVVLNLDASEPLLRLDLPPDPQRSTVTDHIAAGDGTFLDVRWSEDAAQLAFISSSRDHKVAQLRLADARTGAVRDVYREEVATYYESGAGSSNWALLADTGEFIWFSEQDNWGHLYLHDLASGQLKNRITGGSWNVLSIQYLDRQNRQVYFLGSGREPGDPYHAYLYRVGFDGGDLTLLTPEPGHHQLYWDDSFLYYVDRVSTPQSPPVASLRSRDGETLMILEAADITPLLATGWTAPESFVVKARDQVTDLYGLLYRPTNFDPARKYPVLNYVYPGPQTGSVGSRAFRAARADKQSLAELGFIVVEVDAMGTPGRSKSFHDAWYGDIGDNGLPDQIAMIRQLAQRHEWMDLDRVGVWGHSGGGFASTRAILQYPDFYKVAVSSAGNHDNRNYEDDWGEKWQGLLETYPEAVPAVSESGTDSNASAPRTSYDNQANQLLAANLKGKLLLAHGLLDDNVPPTNTLLVVQALIEADKEFDLVVFPEARHGFGNSRYFLKRRWDYFVRHLAGVEPPAEFVFADNIE